MDEDALPAEAAALPGVGIEASVCHPGAPPGVVGSRSLPGVGESVAALGVGGDGAASAGVQGGLRPRAPVRPEHERARLRALRHHPQYQQREEDHAFAAGVCNSRRRHGDRPATFG